MATDYLFVGVGALVWFIGIAMVAWHVRERRRVSADSAISPSELRFCEQQYRRRMQTSALTFTLGALISLCDYLPQFRTSAAFAAAYVVGLLFLCMWLVLLALGDALASRMHMSQSLRRNRQNRQSLQQAIDVIRQQQEDERTRDPDEIFVNESRW